VGAKDSTRRAALLLLVCALIGAACETRADPHPDKDALTKVVPAAQWMPGISFVDVSRQAGVATQPTLTWGATWVDHDLDGDPDLFASRHWHRPRFYINEDGDFHLFRQDFYPYLFDRHACAWGEADGDGTPDLYCTQGADQGQGSGNNQLLIQSGRSFTDRAGDYGVENPFGRSRTINWVDFDSDGDLDIFVGNKLRAGYPNVLYRNDRTSFKSVDVGLGDELNTLHSTWSDWDHDNDPDLLVLRYFPESAIAYTNQDGSFAPIELPGVSGESWSSAVWADFDGDGWDDLALIGEDRAVVMRNQEGRFRPVAATQLVSGRAGAWLDVENDGDLDLFLVQGALGTSNRPDLMLVNTAKGFRRYRGSTFRGPRTGSGESVSVADYDRDGRSDLFVTNGADTHRDDHSVVGKWTLLENRSITGNWVAVDLHGRPRNPWGMGSYLEVRAHDLHYFRHVGDGIGLRSQSEVGHLVLGLGGAPRALIRIVWPNGMIDCARARSHETVELKQGSAPCP
jgi:FG-GAP-like repeat